MPRIGHSCSKLRWIRHSEVCMEAREEGEIVGLLQRLPAQARGLSSSHRGWRLSLLVKGRIGCLGSRDLHPEDGRLKLNAIQENNSPHQQKNPE